MNSTMTKVLSAAIVTALVVGSQVRADEAKKEGAAAPAANEKNGCNGKEKNGCHGKKDKKHKKDKNGCNGKEGCGEKKRREEVISFL